MAITESTLEHSQQERIERIKNYADECEKNGGFTYVFRAELPNENTLQSDYVGSTNNVVMFAQTLPVALQYRRERAKNAVVEESTVKIMKVVIPKKLLAPTGDLALDDAFAKGYAYVSKTLHSVAMEMSDSEIREFIESDDSLIPGKADYLAQFGITETGS